MVLHFPIALLTISWVLVVVRHRRDRPDLETYIRPSLAIGTAPLPVVVATGIRETQWGTLVLDAGWGEPRRWHALIGIAATLVFGWYWWRRRQWTRSGSTPAAADVNLATLGFWLLLLNGPIAGEMVYG